MATKIKTECLDNNAINPCRMCLVVLAIDNKDFGRAHILIKSLSGHVNSFDIQKAWSYFYEKLISVKES